MVQDNVFALLTRGASLHKCTASLDSPLLQRRQQPEQKLKQQQQREGGPAQDKTKKGRRTSESPCSAETVRAQHSITVKGIPDVPAPFLSFSDHVPPEKETAEAKETFSAGDRNTQEPPRRLPPWLVSRLQTLGYKQPTPIQMQALPLMLKGHHMLASAPTGSGKTLAFLLPLIACLKAPSNAFGRLVVLSPTRELARQSHRTFQKLTGMFFCAKRRRQQQQQQQQQWLRPNCSMSVEGTGFKAAFPQSHKGAMYGAADAVFATPLSLLTLLREKRLCLTDCNHLVLDEADRLLDAELVLKLITVFPSRMLSGVVCAAEFVDCPFVLFAPVHGCLSPSPSWASAWVFDLSVVRCVRLPVASSFSPQVDAILSELKGAASATKRLHVCLFSATLPPSVVLLAESIAYGAVHLTVASVGDFCCMSALLGSAGRASAAAPQIEQELLFCSTEAGKLWALKALRLERRLIPPCLIFVEARLDICTNFGGLRIRLGSYFICCLSANP
ncbi:hypothetical protein EBH_0033060 [Eimeria brunetti]|uniref:ATP-dependent RNA helicase n=1 Tax=Eimeria brunetti TaxID=51314 RepID=U6LP57_9EIME|nr:hypothetical protein EBH_0033060 [Eimeria brunetti]